MYINQCDSMRFNRHESKADDKRINHKSEAKSCVLYNAFICNG